MVNNLPRDIGGQPPSTQKLARGRDVIAVIGIDQYHHLQTLHNAVSDAQGVRKLFIEQLHFVELTQPLFDEQATQDAVISLVRDDLASKLQPEDSLVLFFSGHGYTETRKVGTKEVRTGYLVPVEGDRLEAHRFSTYLKLDAFLEDVANLPARHVLLILDACYSGFALGEAVKVVRGTERYTRDLSYRMSRRVITSAMADQPALDSGPIAGHSLFTGTLIEALAYGKADNESQGYVTGTELGLYLQKNVAASSNSSQTPDFGAFELDDRGELVISLGESTVDEAAEANPLGQVPGNGKLEIVCKPSVLSIQPGASARAVISVFNWASQAEAVQVSLKGLPESWYNLVDPAFQLAAGKQQTLAVIFTPPQSSDTRAGRYPFVACLESLNDPALSMECACTLVILPFRQFKSKLQSERLAAGGEGAVVIENQGNDSETYSVSIETSHEAVVIQPAQTQVEVPGGDAQQVVFRAHEVKKRLVGESVLHPFSVQVSSTRGKAEELNGMVVSIPIFQRKILLTLLGIIGILASLFVMYLSLISPALRANALTATYEAGLLSPTTPVITLQGGGDGSTPTDTNTPPIPSDTPTATLTETPTSTPTGTPTPSVTPTLSPTIAPTPWGGALGGLAFEIEGKPYRQVSVPDGIVSPLWKTVFTNMTKGTQYYSFAIAPVGQKMAVWLRGGPGIGSIYMVNSKGEKQYLADAVNGQMAWDTNGQKLAFICRGTFPAGAVANPAICSINVSRGGKAYIWNSSEYQENDDIITPAWSPDGNSLAFATNHGGSNYQLYRVNSDGSSVQTERLAGGRGNYAFPSWSPDGQRIAFAGREANDDYEIYTVSAFGLGRSAAYTQNAIDDCWPAWSPDGSLLAVSTNSCFVDLGVSLGGDIWLLPADGSGRGEKVTNGIRPVWVLEP